jgi:hypothetical protein
MYEELDCLTPHTAERRGYRCISTCCQPAKNDHQPSMLQTFQVLLECGMYVHALATTSKTMCQLQLPQLSGSALDSLHLGFSVRLDAILACR